MNGDDDATLVRRCREGDRHAFELLVLRYHRPVFNAALRMLHDRDDARDVSQTTFLKAYEHLGDYDPRYRFYSWIYRIALNESLNALSSRRPVEAINGREIDGSPGPERCAEGAQARLAIGEALMHLSPELRSVIVLRHLMQLSYQDMSDILLVPEKTVKSRLHTARQLLRSELLPYEATS
ncbi:MAG: sigma-70 family RNA polymerase sigma factor [Proteobacteria bacterium]|nr:sigma-70 family RNA polymerase sigma factor [Pseudomonadota bacterium]